MRPLYDGVAEGACTVEARRARRRGRALARSATNDALAPLLWRHLSEDMRTCTALYLAVTFTAASTSQPSQTVIIVGASRGIGLSLTRRYAAAGFRVHATVRNVSAASALHELAATYNSLVLHPLDVRNATQITALAESVEHADLLIYSAGINHGMASEQLVVNAVAPFAVIEALLPAVLRGQRRFVCLITSDMGTETAVAKRTQSGDERLRACCVEAGGQRSLPRA